MDGGHVPNALAWLDDELRSECSQPVLQRARSIANQWRAKMMELGCLSDPQGDSLTLHATMRGTTSPSSRYETQASLDMHDRLFLARYCTCPAFSGSRYGYGASNAGKYRSQYGYRSFDDDDDYDDYEYVDDYDDYGDFGSRSGSTFGHVERDDDVQSSKGLRYTGMCKHIAAMLLLFIEQPERFHGYQPEQATPRSLGEYMRKLDAKQGNAGEGAQLNLLKRISGAKSRLADEQRGIAHNPNGSKSGKRGNGPVDVTPGGVRLEPKLAVGRDSWSLSLNIGCANTSYAVKDIDGLLSNVDCGTYESYGRKLAFAHTPEMFDDFSRDLLTFLNQVVEVRRLAQDQSGYYHNMPRFGRDIMLSRSEICDLLDLFETLPQNDPDNPAKSSERLDGTRRADKTGRKGRAVRPSGKIGPQKGARPSFVEISDGVHAREMWIMEGNPGFRFDARHEQNGDVAGVRITANRTIDAVLRGRRSEYVMSTETGGTQQPGETGALFRCAGGLDEAMKALEELCGPRADVEGVFVSDDDWPMFSRTILPRLDKAEIDFDIPREVAYRQTECRIEFYLDRDLHGITCEVLARYGDVVFQLVPTAKALRGIISVDGASLAALIKRDSHSEMFAVQVTRQLFPTWSSTDPARIREEDEQTILLMLTDGVEILKSIGQVFSTTAFDGMMKPTGPSVKVGLSIDSNLVEISPIADEVPMNEVGALLESYRRNRRYHRLKDGSFVDLKDADLAELDRIAADFDLSGQQLDSGTVTIPGFHAFLLDSQVDDANKSESFTAYVDELKVIDPQRYQVPEHMRGILRPYQVEGFQWLSTLWDKGFGGILADEMGLGKSVQLLSLIEARKGGGPALIVCPASLVYNWAAECEKFTPDLNVEVVAGTKARRRKTIAAIASACADRPDEQDAPDVVVTSYDLLRRDVDDYQACRFALMALDEAQYIKNHATKLAKAVKQITAEHRFALTGTPIENRLSELWSIFDFLMPGLLGSYTRFREKYEQPIMAPGPEHSVMADKLQALVGLFIKRRLKKDVLTDLPDKFENIVTVKLEGEQRRLYAAHEQRLRATLTKTKDADFNVKKIRILAEFTLLREICCDPRLVYADAKHCSAKLDAISDLVANCIDENKKALIFSQFTSYLDLIGARLAERGVDYYTITGETPKKRRVELVDEFNGNDVPVFLISLKAGNTGLNLVGASVVVHADPWWNAAAQDQATDRAHRIGQKRDVNVYQIVAKDTIEERILKLQQTKNDLAQQFTSGRTASGVGSLTKDDLLSLLD
jgi:superfamily II DNA or RNA helicase